MSALPERLRAARQRLEEATSELEASSANYDRYEAEGYLTDLARFVRATAEHSRALRDLFLLSLEAEPESTEVEDKAVYSFGPSDATRKLRRVCVADTKKRLDRLEDFQGTAEDVRAVAAELRIIGERESAACLLRSLEAR